MEIIEPGHIYRLSWLDDTPATFRETGQVQDVHTEADLIFVNREDTPHGGTQTQEVLRALIDRTMHCDNCLRWEGNDKIIYHLRMALALHEARALERKIEKSELRPEQVAVDADGHFALQEKSLTEFSDDSVTYENGIIRITTTHTIR